MHSLPLGQSSHASRWVLLGRSRDLTSLVKSHALDKVRVNTCMDVVSYSSKLGVIKFRLDVMISFEGMG